MKDLENEKMEMLYHVIKFSIGEKMVNKSVDTMSQNLTKKLIEIGLDTSTVT